MQTVRISEDYHKKRSSSEHWIWFWRIRPLLSNLLQAEQNGEQWSGECKARRDVIKQYEEKNLFLRKLKNGTE